MAGRFTGNFFMALGIASALALCTVVYTTTMHYNSSKSNEDTLGANVSSTNPENSGLYSLASAEDNDKSNKNSESMGHNSNAGNTEASAIKSVQTSEVQEEYSKKSTESKSNLGTAKEETNDKYALNITEKEAQSFNPLSIDIQPWSSPKTPIIIMQDREEYEQSLNDIPQERAVVYDGTQAVSEARAFMRSQSENIEETQMYNQSDYGKNPYTQFYEEEAKTSMRSHAKSVVRAYSVGMQAREVQQLTKAEESIGLSTFSEVEKSIETYPSIEFERQLQERPIFAGNIICELKSDDNPDESKILVADWVQYIPKYMKEKVLLPHAQKPIRLSNDVRLFKKLDSLGKIQKCMLKGIDLKINFEVNPLEAVLPCNLYGMHQVLIRMHRRKTYNLEAATLDSIFKCTKYLADLTYMTRFAVITEIEAIDEIWKVCIRHRAMKTKKQGYSSFTTPSNVLPDEFDLALFDECKEEIKKTFHEKYTVPMNKMVEQGIKQMMPLFYNIHKKHSIDDHKVRNATYINDTWYTKEILGEKIIPVCLQYMDDYWSIHSHSDRLFFRGAMRPDMYDSYMESIQHGFGPSREQIKLDLNSFDIISMIMDISMQQIYSSGNKPLERTGNLSNEIWVDHIGCFFNACALSDDLAVKTQNSEAAAHPLFLNGLKLVYMSTSIMTKIEKLFKCEKLLSAYSENIGFREDLIKLKLIINKYMQGASLAINNQFCMLSLQRARENTMRASIYAYIFGERSTESVQELYKPAYQIIKNALGSGVIDFNKKSNSSDLFQSKERAQSLNCGGAPCAENSSFNWKSLNLLYNSFLYRTPILFKGQNEAYISKIIEEEYDSYTKTYLKQISSIL
ncbi:hypothetical protein NEAUS06_1603 [Nematocida ausubeli]|nr:hypothetical protein NEAUS06_1603 [Nematocida ausubeli]